MPPSTRSESKDPFRNATNVFARTGRQIDSFWRRVTEGVELQALWAQFMAEAEASYSLYTREVDWAAIEREQGARRVFRTVSALFWAMILKLSPARRVFLLIAIVLGMLAVLPGGSAKAGPSPAQNTGLVLVSFAALLFLLALELAGRVTMKRDLEIAREIQRWLVPETPPKVPGLDIAFATRPANTVGGDYYDAFLRETGTGDSPLLLVVADVAGKSVPAALLMATFQASLRTLARQPGSLQELAEGINRYACDHSLDGRRFTTAIFAELRLATRQLSFTLAGHNAPMLRRSTGAIERLCAGNLPLGIEAKARYECASTTLVPGDLLVCFTDGVIESFNARGEDYGEGRLLALLSQVPVETAAATLQRLMASVEAFVGPTRQHDDITCLIVRVI
jgi:sigma-B regulation protein RsbU (phosphoserine phosphatase)